MESSSFNLAPAVLEAFASFRADESLLALPLTLTDDTLQALPPVKCKGPSASFQTALNELDTVLNARRPTYLILRRKVSLVAIAYVPYLAKETQRTFFLDHRHDLVQQLGEEHFSHSIICKEIGEIMDARSWEERDTNGTSQDSVPQHGPNREVCLGGCCEAGTVKDLGYKQNKCRLCDRRMKNQITSEALDALKTLTSPGAAVQIHVDISTETLTLTLSRPQATPDSIASLLPTTHPTFTFFHHPAHQLLYFIFHSPDSATVQQRMKHTMAIPGLLVHAQDVGVVVDQKIEIHEPGDLVFEEKDDRAGKFRSMYDRKGFVGSELVYQNAEADKKFLDALV